MSDHQIDGDVASSGSQTRQVQRYIFASQTTENLADQVAEEVPVAMVYNGISHAVMMATAADLEDFALGFSLSEAIIDNTSEMYDVNVLTNRDAYGIEVQMHISSQRFAALKEKRRHLTGNTGCGLCGKDSLQALPMHVPAIDETSLPARQLPRASLLSAMQAMDARQTINQLTGAVHAAGWVNFAGEIQVLREDVGRHNALDKLLGALAIKNADTSEGFALMSSRLSYELVQKAARANIAILAAVSAPTTLAIDIAEQAGICLIGFVRQHGCVVYTHPERLLAE